MLYYFKCYRPGRAVWTRKKVFAYSLEEAYGLIEMFCASQGYVDYELEESK